MEAISVICEFERLNEYLALRRNGSGKMVKFGNINTNVNHEVVDKGCSLYEECMQRMKFTVVQREKIEGLPKQPERKILQDEKTIVQWHQELDEWQKQAEEIVDKMSLEVLNIDYHLFILDKGEEGSMQVELEMNRELIQVQYSGNRKVMDGILRDIYLYYGVSEGDIVNETERYRDLISVLV